MKINNNKNNYQIGQHLKRLRKQSKLTQSNIGDQVSVCFQQVQKWEKGINRIYADQLLQICELNDWNIKEFKASESSVLALESKLTQPLS